jgi:hypothetical protein
MQIGEQMSHKQLKAVKHITIHTWEWTYEVHLKPLKLIRHSNGLYMNIYVYVRIYEKICVKKKVTLAHWKPS